MSWRIGGSYFESCNCDAICPCRRIDGVAGGRSTHGECLGVLSWLIEHGHADGVELDGLAVALAIRYHDDEPGSPWSFVVYLDERADERQRESLEAIYTGALGGDALSHFPWAWKEATCLAVRPVAIEVSHEPRRQWLRVRDHVSVRIRDRHAGPETVTCVIPGHERTGEELVADELRVTDAGPLDFAFEGNCGYSSTFDYAG
jgi:hypothetical protein